MEQTANDLEIHVSAINCQGLGLSSREPGMAELEQWVDSLLAHCATPVPSTTGNGGSPLVRSSAATPGCSTWNGAQENELVDEAPPSDVVAGDGIDCRDGAICRGEIGFNAGDGRRQQVGLVNHRSHSAFHKWQQNLVLSRTRIPGDGNQVLLRKCTFLLREQQRRGGTLDLEIGSRNQLGDVSSAGGSAARHVVTERERRQTEIQWIEQLRTILPHHSKRDKAWVLGSTVDYIVELNKEHERLLKRKRELEELFHGPRAYE